MSSAVDTALHNRSKLPNIFEIFAQESLHQSIEPACKHIVKVLAEHKPEKFSYIFNHFDELFVLTATGIQYYFLSIHSASLAEFYYGLVRHKTFNSLTFRSKAFSITVLTILPYIKAKIQSYYKDLLESSYTTNKNTLLDKFILKCYPYIHTLYNVLKLYFYLSYSTGSNNFHSPLYKLLTIKLNQVNSFAHNQNSTFFSNLVQTLVTSSAHIGIFLLAFTKWWYSQDMTNHSKSSNKMIPPANTSLSETPESTKKGACPICKMTRRNETALLTSGYVFCYSCIHKFVQKHKKCPVTGYFSDLENLTRIHQQK